MTEFKRMYEKALKEHKERIGSVVEEKTGGGMLEESMEDIFQDTMEEFHQDVVNASDNLAEQAERLESEGKITEQERREFAGITAPKGPPKERIRWCVLRDPGLRFQCLYRAVKAIAINLNQPAEKRFLVERYQIFDV